ncbi:MAG: helix-turn-helix domain-containing protein [Leptospirales bacterium]
MKTKKDSMSVFSKIETGLKEAVAFESGKGKARVQRRQIEITPLPHYKGNTIKHIREELNLSQRMFAGIVGVSIKTIESWESGKSEPSGAAQRLLSIIKKDSNCIEKYELIRT